MNDTLIDPAGTVTEAGTVSKAVLLESETNTPPAGAFAVRVTVQVVEEVAVTLVSVHDTPLTVAGPVRVTVALLEEAFKVPVTVTV
ncbi:MAG: hypothetical protein LAP40_02995 [Acidobacteriia bacterium]|nr:hypothetical protein [Terriglobia bacterium]